MKKNQQKAARQAGLTLIELLVALVISSVIAIAAISALVVSRQGFSSVDAYVLQVTKASVDAIKKLLGAGQFLIEVRSAINDARFGFWRQCQFPTPR